MTTARRGPAWACLVVPVTAAGTVVGIVLAGAIK
jgi:hypothetical protein